MSSTLKVYGHEEVDWERECLDRGYIKAPSWEKRCLAVFDCETLENHGGGGLEGSNNADGVEATLSLVSLAVCDTMTRTPWYNVIDDDDDDDDDTRQKQKLGKLLQSRV